jgi:hypothetical protein
MKPKCKMLSIQSIGIREYEQQRHAQKYFWVRQGDHLISDVKNIEGLLHVTHINQNTFITCQWNPLGNHGRPKI